MAEASTSGAPTSDYPEVKERIGLPPEVANFDSLKDRLKLAAINGDTHLFDFCISKNPPSDFYLSKFDLRATKDCNFLHLIVLMNDMWQETHEKFLQNVFEKLPYNTSEDLLIQKNSNGDDPFHSAGRKGFGTGIKIYFQHLEKRKKDTVGITTFQLKELPWLMLNNKGRTPCHEALYNGRAKTAMELFPKHSRETLSHSEDEDKCGLLYLSIKKSGAEKKSSALVASEILTREDFSISGLNNNENALEVIPYCTSDNRNKILKDLIKKKSVEAKERNKQNETILQKWARHRNLWPFKCIEDDEDLYEMLEDVLVQSMYEDETATGKRKNLFHFLAAHPADKDEAVTTLKFLKKTCEARKQAAIPWFAKDENDETPLHICLNRVPIFEDFAIELLPQVTDQNLKDIGSILVLAIKKGCKTLPDTILNRVDKEKVIQLVDDEGVNALHVAPHIKDDKDDVAFLKQLVKDSKLLTGYTSAGGSILHSWLKIGETWPFKFIFEMDGSKIDYWKFILSDLIFKQDIQGNTIFHDAARYNNKNMEEILKLAGKKIFKMNPAWGNMPLDFLPWFRKNEAGVDALHNAIRAKRQEIAEVILKLHEGSRPNDLLDIYQPRHRTLFLAMENRCYKVVRTLVQRLDMQSWTTYLKEPDNSAQKKNILHYLAECEDTETEREIGTWLVDNAPWDFITMNQTGQSQTATDTQSGVTDEPPATLSHSTQVTDDGSPADQSQSPKSALSHALEKGAEWVVKAMLDRLAPTIDVSTNNSASDPFLNSNWIGACENGHVSTISTFIDSFPAGNLIDLCHHLKDSPLHHINLKTRKEYENFFKIEKMKALVHFQDRVGDTPLHKAIRNGKLILAEMLIGMNRASLYFTNNAKEEARELLLGKYDGEDDWKQMCIRCRCDPRIKMRYLKNIPSMLKMRDALLVVAALVATITFTAGFTLPGGFDSSKGKAILADKPVFIAFLISDTIALCFSMLVLLCLMLSVFTDDDHAMLLTDRSMRLLKLSLYMTMLAFVCGVFVAIWHSSLLVAIVISGLCLFFGVISLTEYLLYPFVDYCVTFEGWCRGARLLLDKFKACRIFRGNRTN